MLMLLCARAHALDPGKAITQYIQATWTNQTGLPQNSVRALAQTTDGYLWLGTEEGLARFDGIRFKIVDRSNSKGLPDNYIIRLLPTTDGALWVATRNALSRYRDGVFKTYTQADGLLKADVSSLCEGTDGSLWIATAAGLNRLKDGRLSSFTENDGLEASNITSMIQTRDGALWLGTPRGLTRFQNGRFATFGARNGLPDDSVEALAQSRDGSLWVATRRGVAHWRKSHATAVPAVVMSAADHIQSLVEDRDGNLWIAWTRRGLTRLDSSGATTYSRADGLPSNNVSALLEDHEGNLWVGSADGGLTELRDGKFTNFGRPEGLSSDNMWSMLESRDGAIWVGTDDGGVNRISGNTVNAYTTKQGLASNTVNGMFEAADGSIWLGSEDGWITRINGTQITKYRDPESKSARVVAIQGNPDGSLWIGFHETNGLVLLQNGRFVHFAVPGLINTFVSAGQGGLWIGTDYGGVSHFREGKLATYTKRDGLLSDFAQAVYVDKQGTVWAGTSPGGLNRIKNGRITSFAVDQGLFNETVGAIIEDNAGYLWMTCNKGIFKVLKQELNDYAEGRVASIHSIVYGTADGMRSPECNFGATPSVWKSRDGHLWFATSSGVARIDPNHIAGNKRPPTVWIESVLFDQKPVPMKSAIQLGPESGRMEIQFSAPSFIAPDRIHFRYRLFGFENDWNDPGITRTASYTNLPPGKYHLSVQAANSDGVWSLNEARLDFAILPHWYQTRWLQILFVIGLIYGGRTISGLRMRYLLRRNEELSTRVAERTAELESAMRAGEVSREALREQATRDGLTGLWNRNAIFEILERELIRGTREGTPVSVLMADLDYFKLVNDTYGHMAGDDVLREATRRIRELMRSYDSAGRYGGEEILIVLPNCSLADARHRAEELRLAVSGQKFLLATGTLFLTCSFGVACSKDQKGSGALVSAADSALYNAKSNGRNRVEIYAASMQELSPSLV